MDAPPPRIVCPADVRTGTGPGDTDCAVPLALRVTATDNCDSTFAITDDAPALYPVGTTVVTFTARDTEGNASSCQTIVEVVDDTPPDLSCPAYRTIPTGPLDDDCLVPVSLPATATDNCDASVVVTSDAPPLFPLGTTVVTFRTTDSAGNTATCGRS